MARLMIVTTEELVPGYRLAGAAAIAAATAEEAAAAVRRLANERDVAIIGVHQPFFAAFEPRFVAELERRVLPVVIDLPSGEVGAREGRRARLVALLRRAIGRRIAFGRDGGRP